MNKWLHLGFVCRCLGPGLHGRILFVELMKRGIDTAEIYKEGFELLIYRFVPVVLHCSESFSFVLS